MKISFKTKDGKIIADSYQRVVVGGQGPYIEFSESDFVIQLITKPGQEYRGHGKYAHAPE